MPLKSSRGFQWTDNETELLNVTHDYLVCKSSESLDWELVRSKDEDILKLVLEALPDRHGTDNITLMCFN